MLRRSAMKRALRQSSGSYKDLQKETSTVAENIKTNVTDTSGSNCFLFLINPKSWEWGNF